MKKTMLKLCAAALLLAGCANTNPEQTPASIDVSVNETLTQIPEQDLKTYPKDVKTDGTILGQMELAGEDTFSLKLTGCRFSEDDWQPFINDSYPSPNNSVSLIWIEQNNEAHTLSLYGAHDNADAHSSGSIITDTDVSVPKDMKLLLNGKLDSSSTEKQIAAVLAENPDQADLSSVDQSFESLKEDGAMIFVIELSPADAAK